jgi:hypothetical protein
MCWNGTAAAAQLGIGCLDFSLVKALSRQDRFLRPDVDVIWFFERRGEHMRCEIRQQVEGDRFALVVTLPDGTERTEWFDDSNGLTRRSVELDKMLREKGWNGPFARDI